MRALILAIVIVAGVVGVNLWQRKNERDQREPLLKGEEVLAQLARGEPLAPDVDLLFPSQHPENGTPVIPVERERFVQLLRAGAYRPAPFVVAFVSDPGLAREADVHLVGHQPYVMAGGQSFTLFTRRQGQRWQVAVVM